MFGLSCPDAAADALEALHIGLDVAGFIPGVGEVADLANAGIYAAEGDYLNAGISLAGAVPVIGSVATGARLADGAFTATKALGKRGDNVLGATTKKVPNPGGRLGGPAHRATVERRINDLKQQSFEIIGGGTHGKELYIPTQNGAKRGRFADIAARDPRGNLYLEQVGRQNKNGTPVKRERDAIADIQEARPDVRIVFTPYNA